MNSAMIVLAVLATVALLAVVLLGLRAGRSERLLRDELGETQLTLAAAQREAAERMASSLTEVVDRFHRALGDFGQQVSSGHATVAQSLQGGLEEARRTLSEQLRGLVGEVNTQLVRSQETFGQRFEGATKVFGELRGQLGQVAEMAKRMESLGREIDELQGILKAPKLRGGMGETQLEEFLRQVLPGAFWETQHAFSGGQKVDAVIRLGERLVPVDAKFPLESFQRLLAAEDDAARRAARREFDKAVKGRIDEIATKYLRPGEGTYDFGLMFIPAENVYYEVIIRDEALGEGDSLLAYATSKRIVPVSPNSFYAYLMTIATGLRGLQVEARAREILGELGRLHRDFDRFAEAFDTLGKHLDNARKKYEDADKLASRLGDRLQAVAAGTAAEALPAEVAPPDPGTSGGGGGTGS